MLNSLYLLGLILVLFFQSGILVFAKAPNFFIENKGQWGENILFLYQGAGLNAWITKEGICYDFYKYEYSTLSKQTLLPEVLRQREGYKRGHVVKVAYVGASSNPSTIQERKLKAYYNYFIGNDPTRWCSYVTLSEQVVIKNIYPGIDQRWYFDNGYLRYDFIVHPYADYKNIRLKIEGAYQVMLKDGELVFNTRFGEVKQCQLKVYQDKNILSAAWTKNNNGEYGFVIRYYDPSQALVIDPLVWSTFIGGSNTETLNYGYPAGGLFVDNADQACIAATSHSADYPTTTGAYDTSINSVNEDVVVSKLDNLGANLVFSTFFGGNWADVVCNIKKDNADNIYIAGWTQSSMFPLTTGVVDNILIPSANGDGFVAKLDATGSSLSFSTYLGGTGVDVIFDLEVDDLQNVYVTGYTTGDFPVTTGAYDVTFNGGNYDAFISKLNSTATSLTFSTYLGGSTTLGIYGDRGKRILVDNLYDVYVVGTTASDTFPVTVSAYDNTFNGWTDVFVTKISSSGNTLLYSTYVGGNSTDDVFDAVLAPDNKVYFTGYTFSTNYPVSTGCYDNSYACCSQNVIVSCLNASGSLLPYSTYIGNNSLAHGISLDNKYNIYITGIASNLYVTTSCAYDETHNGGGFDGFISKLDSALTTLMYSTYIGGSGEDYPYYIKAFMENETYITGWTQSLNYPISTGCYDNTHGGNSGGNTDVFVSKLSLTDICLPLHTLYLTAHYEQNQHYLRWQLTGEKSAIYEVFVKDNITSEWTLLARTSKNDAFFTPASYMHTTFYFVIARDKDGQRVASQIIEVAPLYAESWRTYPNPTQNTLFVENYLNRTTEYELLDVTGKVLQRYTLVPGRNEIQLDFYSPGLYFIREKVTGVFQKFLIEKH
ncbi:MAG: SBBP repeat-containing protein [Bacteroidia bacterium]|nr:SBBP repeat-containing protein [Bacteroidia bacterium]MDW8347698.1 SBBP repeat-containing protein [Bacteroidia bacterium]